MKRETAGQILSAVFVDYDNIYLSLKRKNEEAAKRFAKDAGAWLAEIESGRLITPTNKLPANVQRRIVLNRCYGNPVPRRNQNDNSTDMSSFPFVRHHFLRAGFEVVDCPPLTAQLKNSSDIRMVMDVRDYLHHDTYFDEFVILSGDADFTPVLHRLRAHARRTVVFANDFTAAPYVAIADGEIRESDLMSLILENRLSGATHDAPAALAAREPVEDIRREIIAEISTAVRGAGSPLPLEALAERATRLLGHERTVGSNWAGAGSFRELLLQSLPEGIRLSEQPPYVVYDAARKQVETPVLPRAERLDRTAALAAPRRGAAAPGATAAEALTQALEPAAAAPKRAAPAQPAQQSFRAAATPPAAQPRQSGLDLPKPPAQRSAAPPPSAPPPTRSAENAAALQQSIARIHEACQAPPLSPPEYRALFELLAQELNEAGLQGAQTVASVAARAREIGLDIRGDDIRFALDVVSEADPWFEQGASANLFAGRFRNFVVARCRGHGLSLTPDEIDLIDAWFTGAGSPPVPARQTAPPPPQPAARAPTQTAPIAASDPRGDRWWNAERQQSPDLQAPAPRRAVTGPAAEPQPSAPFAQGPDELAQGDEFPRIVRTRLRG
ncbi:MAG: NYN domain-containing protein [Hyphomicrobiaceae bacterium]|nr:NYN domain-containing protein [Hyphomicrobiaceae bacterium]